MPRRDHSDEPSVGMFSMAGWDQDLATSPGGGPFDAASEPCGDWRDRFEPAIEDEEATSLFCGEDMPWNAPITPEDLRDQEALQRARAATAAAERAAQREAIEAAESLAVESVVAAEPIGAGDSAALFVPRRPAPTSGVLDSAVFPAPIVCDEPSIEIELHTLSPLITKSGQPPIPALAEGTPNPELIAAPELPWFVRTDAPRQTAAPVRTRRGTSGPTKQRRARGSGPQGFPMLPQTIMTIPPEQALAARPMSPLAAGSVDELSAEQLRCKPRGLVGWVKSKLKK